MRLSVRLQNIADQVDCRRVADIGCDHGKLTEYLFESDRIDYAFVTDISRPSVQKAVDILSMANRDFDWACGDGTECISPSHKVEQGIIAGMGGRNIIKILTDDKSGISSWVLQPQNNEVQLKKYLVKNKYHIVCDYVVKEKNMFYNILKVRRTNCRHKYSKYHMYMGKDNFDGNKYFVEYLDYLQRQNEFLIKNAPFSVRLKAKKVLKYIDKARKEIK